MINQIVVLAVVMTAVSCGLLDSVPYLDIPALKPVLKSIPSPVADLVPGELTAPLKREIRAVHKAPETQAFHEKPETKASHEEPETKALHEAPEVVLYIHPADLVWEYAGL